MIEFEHDPQMFCKTKLSIKNATYKNRYPPFLRPQRIVADSTNLRL